MILKQQGYNGFTIVELLVVIVVIAILAAITVVSYNGISNRATESSVGSDIEQLGKQIEIFKAVNGRYPTIPASLAAGPAPEIEEILRKTGLYAQTRSQSSLVSSDAGPNRTKSFVFCASNDGSQIAVVAWAPIVKGISSTELDKAIGKPMYYYTTAKSNGQAPFKNTAGVQDSGMNACNSVVDGFSTSTWVRRWSFDAPTKDADAQ